MARLGVLLLSAVALVVPAGAQAAWTPPTDLQPASVTAGSVVSAAGPDGTAVVAWTRSGLVEAAVKPPGSAFGAAVTLAAGAAPDVAVDAQGRVLVAWKAGDDVAFAQGATGGGTPVFAGQAVSRPALSRFAVAYAPSGRVLVAYATSSTRGLVTRAPGAPSFAPAWSTPATTTYTSLDVGGGPEPDTAWTAWTDSTGSPATSRVVARRWTAAGGAEADQVAGIVTDATTSGGVPSTTTYTLDGGRVVIGDRPSVLWRTHRRTSVFGIPFDTYDNGTATATGATLAPLQVLESVSQTMFSTVGIDPPSAAVLGSGATVYGVGAFQQVMTPPPSLSSTGYSAIRTGASFDPVTATVATSTVDRIQQVQVAPLPANRAVLVYQRGPIVAAQSRSAAGPAEGGEVLVADDAGAPPTGLSVAGTPDGGALAAWTRSIGGQIRVQAALDDESPPVATIAGPASVVAGAPATFRIPGDRWSATVANWALGDGATATGLSATHVFATAGTYTLAVTATDAAGNAATATRSVTVTAPAVARPPVTGTAPSASAGDRTAPRLTRVTLSPTRFAVAPRNPRKGAVGGATLRFDLSEAATLTLTVQRTSRGYRSASGRCVRAAPKGKPKRRCTLVTSVGTTSAKVKAGAGRLTISGRVGARRLTPRAYRLSVVARDGAGNRSAPVVRAFTIRPG